MPIANRPDPLLSALNAASARTNAREAPSHGAQGPGFAQWMAQAQERQPTAKAMERDRGSLPFAQASPALQRPSLASSVASSVASSATGAPSPRAPVRLTSTPGNASDAIKVRYQQPGARHVSDGQTATAKPIAAAQRATEPPQDSARSPEKAQNAPQTHKADSLTKQRHKASARSGDEADSPAAGPAPASAVRELTVDAVDWAPGSSNTESLDAAAARAEEQTSTTKGDLAPSSFQQALPPTALTPLALAAAGVAVAAPEEPPSEALAATGVVADPVSLDTKPVNSGAAKGLDPDVSAQAALSEDGDSALPVASTPGSGASARTPDVQQARASGAAEVDRSPQLAASALAALGLARQPGVPAATTPVNTAATATDAEIALSPTAASGADGKSIAAPSVGLVPDANMQAPAPTPAASGAGSPFSALSLAVAPAQAEQKAEVQSTGTLNAANVGASPNVAMPVAAQPMASANAAAAPALVAQATVAAPLGHPAFAEAVSGQVAVWVGQGVQEARLHLNPQEMGPVQVWIALEGTQAQVRFVAEQAPTREALQAALADLAQALGRDGLKLEAASVQTQAQSHAQFGAQGGFSQGGNPGEAPRGRRPNGSERELIPQVSHLPARVIGGAGANLLDLYA